jgi:hypothetical protein
MPPAEPARFHCGERREVKRLEQAHFALAFEAPAFRHRDCLHRADLRRHPLGGGMSSRLFQKLREERGLCYTTFAQAGRMTTPARSPSMPAPGPRRWRAGGTDHRRDPPRRRGRDRAELARARRR